MNIVEPLLRVWGTFWLSVASTQYRFWSGLFDGSRTDTAGQSRSESTLEHEISELLDELRAKRGGLDFADSAREVFRLLGEIPAIVHWNTGLADAHRELILATVHEAERFGDTTGEFKRRFAVDMTIRVLRRYNLSGLPIPGPIEDTFIKPFVGINIDWCVTVLNINNAWPPVRNVQIPRLFQGRYGRFLQLGASLLRIWVWLREMFFYPSKYERQLRSATKNLEPQINDLLEVLPPASIHKLAERIATIIARAGQLTAPHVRTINSLLTISAEIQQLTQKEREDVIVTVMRRLLRKAYARSPFAVDFIDSVFGDYLLREMVRNTEWVLARNGLLPSPTRSER